MGGFIGQWETLPYLDMFPERERTGKHSVLFSVMFTHKVAANKLFNTSQKTQAIKATVCNVCFDIFAK